MKHVSIRLFPIVLVALFAALTFWLERATRTDGGRAGNLRHDPDYIVERFELRRFDREGVLQHTLVAQKMLHYPDDESTEVAAPHLTYHRTPPTEVTADKAWLDKDGKHVRLDGNVVVIKAGVGDRPPTRVDTTVLFAVPDDEYAYTDAPTKISQGQTVINGSGFEANNKTRLSLLRGRVNGIIYSKRAESGTKP